MRKRVTLIVAAMWKCGQRENTTGQDSETGQLWYLTGPFICLC